MNRDHANKLSPYTEQILQWIDGEQWTYAQIKQRLKQDHNLDVSTARLCQFYQREKSKALESAVFDDIRRGAEFNRNVDAALAGVENTPLSTLIRLVQQVVFTLTVKGHSDPTQLELVASLIKPVLEFKKLEDKERNTELSISKFRRETVNQFADWVKNEKILETMQQPAGADRTEALGRLMFGELWKPAA